MSNSGVARSLMHLMLAMIVAFTPIQGANAESFEVPVFKVYSAGASVDLTRMVLQHSGLRHLRRHELQSVVVQIKARSDLKNARIALHHDGRNSVVRTVSGFPGSRNFSSKDPETFERLIFNVDGASADNVEQTDQKRRRRDRDAQQRWALLIGDASVFLGTVKVVTSERSRVEICLEHSHRSPTSGVSTQGPACASEAAGATISLGDDTGYRDQKLRMTSRRAEVCLSHSRISGRGKTITSGWQCSARGKPSQWIDLGDDTGYRQQQFQILHEGRLPVCLRFNNGRGWSQPVCSQGGRPSAALHVGNDEGYRTQILELSVPR